MGDEVLGDLLVAAALEALRVGGAVVLLAALGVEGEAEGVREADGEPGHRVLGADRVGEGGLDPRLLVSGERGVLQEFLQGAADAGERARHGGVDPLGHHVRAGGAQFDQPHGLAVVDLGEGIGERGTGVADPFVDRLAAVQMAECGVVDAVEEGGGHRFDPADGDVAFAVAGLAAGDEGVREDDGPGAGAAGGEVVADPVHGGAEHRLVAHLRCVEGVLDQGRFEVRQPVERDLAVYVAQYDGVGAPGGVGPQVDPGPADQPGPHAEPPGGVVVAGDHHGGHTEVGEAVQYLIEQLDGGQGGTARS